jgi:hypothetical protein
MPTHVTTSATSSKTATPVISRALINLVEAQFQKTAKANGRVLINSVAGALLGAKHCTLAEWRTVIEALERGERVGRIILVKCATQNASYLRIVTPSASLGSVSSAPTASTPASTMTSSSSTLASSLITRALIRAIEARITEFADSAGCALMTTIGGMCGNAAICTRDQWQAVTQALERGDAVGRIVLINSGVKQTWQLRLAADVSGSSPLPLSSSSATNTANATPSSTPTQPQSLSEAESPVSTAPVVPQPTVMSMATSSTANATPAPPSTSVPNFVQSPLTQYRQLPSKPDEIILVDSFQKAVAARAVLLHECTVVGVDCEGSLDNDDAFYLRLVQVGTQLLSENVHRTYVFDMQFAEPALEASTSINECLRTLMSSVAIVKVFHDLRLDVPAICRQTALNCSRVQSIFDTQVAFEMLAENGIIARGYEGPRASLNDVLNAFE